MPFSPHIDSAVKGGLAVPGLDLWTEDVVIARLRNILVVGWRNKTTGIAARDVALRMRRLARRYPDGVFYLALVAQKAPPPELEARQALADMLKAGAQSIAAGARWYWTEAVCGGRLFAGWPRGW